MSPTRYSFRHTTVVPAEREAVHALLVDLEHYVEWWPQVRAVASLGPDDALVVCRSRLPYELELVLHAESRDPHVLQVRIDGPIRGFARWALTPVADGTRLDFEQEVEAVAPAFRWASYVVRPLLAANHAAMMRGAEQGLTARFARRRSLQA